MIIWTLCYQGNLITGTKYCGKEGILGANSSLFHNIFNISLTSGVKLHIHFVKCGCSIYFFLNFANLLCRGTDISKHSESPLDFEITRRSTVYLFQLRIRIIRNKAFRIFMLSYTSGRFRKIDYSVGANSFLLE